MGETVDFSRKSCLAKGPNITHLTNDESLQNSTTVKECFCGKGTMDCPVGAEGPEPPKVQLASYDILANMTAHNISSVKRHIHPKHTIELK